MAQYEAFKPFFGVSGVVDTTQQEAIADIANDLALDDIDRTVALGIQTSYTTQVEDKANKYGDAYFPVGEQLRDAIRFSPEGLEGIVHIALRPDLSPDDISNRLLIDRISQRSDRWRQGIQINMARVESPEDCDSLRRLLGYIRHCDPIDRLVLQIHPGMEANADFMRDLSWDFSGLVDDVLIDPSGGKGQQFDIERTRDLVGKILSSQPSFGIVIAGGLSGENVDELFAPFLEDFPDISCDAEGRLRRVEDGRSVLYLAAVKDYLSACAAAVRARKASHQSILYNMTDAI